MIQDIRYSTRLLLKQPGFALVAILSLALGIGANTAIFSLIDALMLKSLPVREPGELVLFGRGETGGLTNSFPNTSWDLFSYPFFKDARQRSDVFSDVASLLSMIWTAHGTVSNQSGTRGDIRKLRLQLVSGNYFSTLGVNAAYGRMISDSDDETIGAHPVAVLSQKWWQKNLGGARDAVGKTIRIEETSYTIIGIAPAEFYGTTVGDAPDIWVPLAMEPQVPPAHWNQRNDKRSQSLHLIARLKNGVQIEQANTVVNLLFKQFLHDLAGSDASPERMADIERANIQLTPAGKGLSSLRNEFSLSLKILMVVVAVVLLIACANVANLLLSRSAARQREFAVRVALGAGRTRLIRQLLLESLLLSVLGAVAGVALAWWGSRVLVLMASNGPEPAALDVSPNLRILGFTMLVSVLSAVIFGLAPALRAASTEPNSSLKIGRGSLQVMHGSLGKILVVAQVALSLVLLVGAGLFVRTLINLHNIPTGFNRESVALFSVDPTVTGYKDAQLAEMQRQMEDKVRAIPGVQAAAFAFLVFNQGQWTSIITTSDQNPLAPQDRAGKTVRNNVVGADFFKAMEIPFVLGRNFGPQDISTPEKVAVINETFARRWFPNSSPLGKRFDRGDEPRNNIEIIGVVKDARLGGLTEAFVPTAFYPSAKLQSNFLVRFSGRPDTIIPQVRRALLEVNSNLPIDEVISLSEHVDRSLTQQNLIARLASFFGLLALLLASVGLYGVLSYGVERRTSEIGIRMALGAVRWNVLWLVLRQAAILVAIGLVIGLSVALMTTRAASTLLYGLKSNDPVTIVTATLILIVVAVIAGCIPALRAARIDPMVALRTE